MTMAKKRNRKKLAKYYRCPSCGWSGRRKQTIAIMMNGWKYWCPECGNDAKPVEKEKEE
jgi:predicted RNA-binding Zn-ribbon protein involved in translation (DUF1610 family)